MKLSRCNFLQHFDTSSFDHGIADIHFILVTAFFVTRVLKNIIINKKFKIMLLYLKK
jgi:hypothetical protein